jgi:hypothetical protein
MSGQLHATGRCKGGPILALGVFVALFVSSLAPAAAPPPRLPEAPAPGPLFPPEEVHINPLKLSVAAFGASAQPITGRVASLAALFAGETHKAWNLDGPLTNRYSRISVGAATLVLGGFGPSAGTVALTELANLGAGHYLDCWALLDTDQFRRLPNEWLEAVSDGKAIPVGGVEAEIYARVVTRANYTSSAAFARAARKEVTYTHVYSEPDRYRGVVVHVEGRLLRVNRYDPPHEATDAGVNDLYEAWVFNEQLGANPYCIVFTEWPADLPRDLLGEPKIGQVIKVSINGYFFKKFRYKANDRHSTQREAPLVIGHGLVVLSMDANGRSGAAIWMSTFVWVFAGILGALVAGVVALTFWYRRSDDRVRRRILARMPEFALPPPDVPAPVAAPVASPVGQRRLDPAPHTSAPRFSFPTGSGERGSPRSGDEGGSPSKKEHPPDEGAGA